MAHHRNPTARQADLLDRLNKTGFMSVGDLAAASGVSPITVRRDLAARERAGDRWRRAHGGPHFRKSGSKFEPWMVEWQLVHWVSRVNREWNPGTEVWQL